MTLPTSGADIEAARERKHIADGVEQMLASLPGDERAALLALVPGLSASLEHMFEGADAILHAMVAECIVMILSQLRRATLTEVSDLLRHTSGGYAVLAAVKRGAYELPEPPAPADEAKIIENIGMFL